MTDEEKIKAIKEYVSKILYIEYSEDVYSDSGGNFDDAYNMGYEAGESYACDLIKQILDK